MVQNSQLFEQLKQKYQSVLNLVQQLQVRILTITMDGNKLLIRGVAPTQAAKSRIWDQIRLVDPGNADLVCDLTAPQPQPARAPASMTAGVSASGGQNQRRYTVKPGDTLSTISSRFYGDANQYPKIYNANRSLLPDVHTIRPGQELVIPE